MELTYMPRVIDAEYVGDDTLRIGFTDRKVAVIDFSNWLDDGMFEPLQDKAEFRTCFVDGWTVSWPNGADIAPETLYEDARRTRTPYAERP